MSTTDNVAELPSGGRVQCAIASAFVFALAVALRLPSTFESFWLDELHSAWCVWGSLDDVMPRSTAGNQTPVYFWLLWFWKQFVGEAEWALRLPSVIGSSLAAGIVTFSLSRYHGRLLGAMVAGMVLAGDQNALFFGTELRTFAPVIFLGSVACALSVSSLGREAKAAGLLVVAVISGLIQPTSLGVYAWALIAEGWKNRSILQAEETSSKAVRHLALWILFSCLALGALIWLSGGVLSEAWKHREQWQSMGAASSFLQIWRVWPWLWLIAIPLGCSLWFRWLGRASRGRDHRATTDVTSLKRDVNVWSIWLTTALLATALFWLLSAMGIASVFHRRYFVACLPMIAFASGDLVNVVASACQARRSRAHAPAIVPVQCFVNWLPLAMALAMVLGLLWSQGTVSKWVAGHGQLVRRGEGWREAVLWLEKNRSPSTHVSLEPGLIESSRLLRSRKPSDVAFAQWYLTNPLSGPYQWPRVVPFDGNRMREVSFPVVWRGSRAAAERMISSGHFAEGGDEITIHSFGNVQILEKTSPNLPEP